MLEIRRLTAAEAHHYLAALAEVLVDCVEGGASVGFIAPFSKADAEAYLDGVIQDVAQGKRILLAAFADSQLMGTVQIVTDTPPNQPHRADVSKLLVRRSARRQGVGRQLMKQVEEVSGQEGRTLLVLDTATGDPAEQLYLRLGWNRVGVIPRYARYPDGRWGDTAIFWKHVA